jgi:hypothetical protein
MTETETETKPNLLTASITGISTWKHIPRIALNNIAECLGEDSIKWKILNRTTHTSAVLNEVMCRVCKTYHHRSQAFREMERTERMKRDLDTLNLSHLSIEQLDFISVYCPFNKMIHHETCMENTIRFMAENARLYPLDTCAVLNNIRRGGVLLLLFRESPCQQSYFANKPITERTSNERLLYLYIALIYLEWCRRDPSIHERNLSIYVDQLTGRRVSTGRANKRKYRIVDERALHLAQFHIHQIQTLGLENALEILQKYS